MCGADTKSQERHSVSPYLSYAQSKIYPFVTHAIKRIFLLAMCAQLVRFAYFCARETRNFKLVLFFTFMQAADLP
jgi:hypothetical protein